MEARKFGLGSLVEREAAAVLDEALHRHGYVHRPRRHRARQKQLAEADGARGWKDWIVDWKKSKKSSHFLIGFGLQIHFVGLLDFHIWIGLINPIHQISLSIRIIYLDTKNWIIFQFKMPSITLEIATILSVR